MAEITAARINNLQSRIELILGNGAGRNGYGQALESTPVQPNSIVDADHINNIYADIIKARIHQVGPSDQSVTSIAQILEDLNVIADETSFTVSNTGVVADDPDGSKKGIADFEDLMSQVETDKSAIHPSQASTETALTSSRTTVWNGLIYHEFIVTFNTGDARRHFFNTGGQIRIDPSNLNASTPKGLDWAALTSEVGIIIFDSDSTSSTSGGGGTASGNYDLTSEYSTIFTKVGSGSYSGVYAGNTFIIQAREISETQISFRVEFNDVVTDGAIDNNVDGTLSNSVTIYRSTGEVSVPVPGVFTNVALGGQQSGSLPTYVLTASSSAVNEGSSFTITLSTSNVPTGSTLPYTITGISSNDLVEGSLTGAFTTDGNGIGIKSFTVISDQTTEGVEYFELRLDNDKASTRVAINDTSSTPTPATYLLQPSTASVNEGGTISFTLNTTNVSNGTEVPFSISGIQREDLSIGSYTWDNWYNEFRTVYWSGFNKDSVIARKDLILSYYEGNDEYATDFGTRYGLFRRPDAAGIAYWVNESLKSYGTGISFTNAFFSNIANSNTPLPYIDANGTESDSSRSAIFDKTFLYGTGAGVVGDRGAPGGGVSTDLTDVFTVYSNTAVKNYNLIPDYTTEGPEVIVLQLDNGQSTASVSVNDTSRTPDPGEPPAISIPEPLIGAFVWNRGPAYWGDPVFTAWQVYNADTVNVSISGPGISFSANYTEMLGRSSDIIVNEEDGVGTLTATLTATGAGGSVTATTEIPVAAPLPSISAFFREPAFEQFIEVGTPVNYVYKMANTVSAQITTNYGVTYDITDLPPTGAGETGTITFTSEEIGTKIATLTASNAEGITTSQTISFNVQDTAVPEPVSWLVEPEWSGLQNSVTIGTTGRGYAKATGDINLVTWAVIGPSGNKDGTSGISSGEGYFTPNYLFSEPGNHQIGIQVTGSGGTISGNDFVNVLSVEQPAFDFTPTSAQVQVGGFTDFVLTTENVSDGAEYTAWFSKDGNNLRVPGTINNGTAIYRFQAATSSLEGEWDINVREGSLITGTIVATGSLNVTQSDPTYSLAPDITEVDAGQSKTFTLTTENISDGTTIYFEFINALNGAEIYTLETTVSNNTATVVFDSRGKSTEIYAINVYNTTLGSTVVASGAIRILAAIPTYTLTPSSLTVVDGESIGPFTLTTTNISDGTELFATIDKESNGATVPAGSPTINNNTVTANATFPQGTFTPASDYRVSIRTGSYSGNVVTYVPLTITAAPTYTLSPDNATMTHQQGVFYSLTTTNVPDGTTVYWHTGTTSNAAVADNSGAVTITNNFAQFAYAPVDIPNEPGQLLTYVRIGGLAGTLVAAASIEVVDDFGA